MPQRADLWAAGGADFRGARYYRGHQPAAGGCAFDLAAELARDFAEEFARLEGAAFVNGNGTTQPEGFLVSSATLRPLRRRGAGCRRRYRPVPQYPVDLLQPGHLGDAARDDRQHPQAEGDRHGQLPVDRSLQPGNPPSILGRPVVEMPDIRPSARRPIR